MAQNCRIPGHAGPVRRADFGVCGGAFRIAGAEKADRRSRQSLPFAFLCRVPFLGAVSEIRASLPGSGAFGRRTERFVKMRFGGHGEHICSAVLAIEEEGVFLYSQIMEDFRRMKPGMEKRAVRVKEVFMVQRGMYGTVIS